MIADYTLAFTTGLLGGFGHCIGMCGPIVASFGWRTAASGSAGILHSRHWVTHLLYHGGRILTYTLVGLIMGLSGSFVNVAGKIAGLQNIVAVVAGLLMVLMGLSIAGVWQGAVLLEKNSGWILSTARRIAASTSSSRFFLLGLILGLLPCGLSYTVFIAAAGTGNMLSGALIAFLFGLGTLPAVLLFGALVASIGARLRGMVYRLGGVAIMFMGILFILRGVRGHAGL